MANEGIKIGIFMSSLQIGARENLIFQVGKDLSKKGHKVLFVFIGAHEKLLEKVDASCETINLLNWSNRIPLIRKVNKIKLFLGIWHLKKFLNKEEPDVFLSISIPPNLAALVAKTLSKAKTKIIVRQSNIISIRNYPEYKCVKKRMRDFLIPMLYKNANGFIAVSNGVKENLQRLLGKSLNVRVIYNKVLDKNWRDEPKRKPKHSWFHDPNLVVFLAVGRLVAKKDYPTMIKAFQVASNTNHSIRLIILGDGPQKNKIEDLIKNLKMKDKIQLQGHVQNTQPYYYYSYGFLLSSVSEGMPSSVIEALGATCQIVATDCPSGPSEILAEGKYGRLVKIKDHKMMAQKILESLEYRIPEAKLLERAGDFTSKDGIKEYSDAISGFFSGN